MTPVEVDDSGKRFLIALYDAAGGDISVTASMYDIGTAAGLDRDGASRVAEDLIGLQLLEIKSLSGGVSLSKEGAEAAVKLGAAPAGAEEAGKRLGEDPIIDETAGQAVEQVASEIKSNIGGMNLGYDILCDLVADLKTIDAQMSSSRPKTAVIRECFRSIEEILEKAGLRDNADSINRLLGE
jgi:hypothetical protein